MAGFARPEPIADPAGDGGLEGGDVDAAEDARVGRLAESPTAGEAEGLEQRPAAFLAVLDDGLVAGLAGQHGDNGQAEEGRQGMAFAPGPAWIVQALKESHQSGGGIHTRIPMSGPWR